MTRSRLIHWRESGGTHSIELPNIEERGVTALPGWVKRSPIPGTPRWEWAVCNMPVRFVTGMCSGYARTRWGAKRALRRAFRFWESYGYTINWESVR